jgi:hypothetical protein
MTKIGWYANLTTEQKRQYNQKRRKKYNAVTKEEAQKRKQIRNKKDKERLSKMTLAQLAEYKSKTRKRWEKYQANLPAEKKRKIYEKCIEHNRKWYASLSPQEKEKQKERMRQRYRNLTPEQHIKERERFRQYRETVKFAIINHYSNGTMKCAKCGYSDIRALCIDHINGGGRKHAIKLRKMGTNLYPWLIKQNFPIGYQVLCANCNNIKKIENKEDPYGPKEKKGG